MIYNYKFYFFQSCYILSKYNKAILKYMVITDLTLF